MSAAILSILSMRMDVGYPWERLYVDWQISEKVSVFGLYEQPSLMRIQPNAGLSMVWLDRSWNVTGEMLLGSVVQNAQIVKKGPSAEFRITTHKSVGTVRPWLYLGWKESIFIDKWIIESADGTREELVSNRELTLPGGFGIDFIVQDWTVGVGLDLPWVDVPTPSIPGIHFSVGKGGNIR